MRAVESVCLEGAANADLVNQFAAAVRGDFQTKWAGFSDQQKIAFISKFANDLKKHTERAFETGVNYGAQRG